jgi:hypothetical protein
MKKILYSIILFSSFGIPFVSATMPKKSISPLIDGIDYPSSVRYIQLPQLQQPISSTSRFSQSEKCDEELSTAAVMRDQEVVHILVNQFGVDMDMKNKDRSKSLLTAAVMENLEMVKC